MAGRARSVRGHAADSDAVNTRGTAVVATAAATAAAVMAPAAAVPAAASPAVSSSSRSPSWWRAFAAVVIIGLLHAGGVYVYGVGFFLTRFEVPSVSKCMERPVAGAGSPAGGEAEGCWMPRRFDRAVILIIDALRYDFVAPQDDSQLAPEVASATQHFRNHLPAVAKLLDEQPTQARLYKFLADPPTVTMQRLKGITSGSLPTFIDVRNNFDSPAIEEDNIIAQARANGKKMVFMGDDTWQMLFPGGFNASYPYPSFNVKDLHTVDNGVLDHLVPELVNRTADWDFVVAHFLGVDHVGHKHGPAHPAMHHKLNQMNAMLEDVVANIDDSTLLIVMGDHGMTPDGNHGGATDEEVSAALFMYTKAEGGLVHPSLHHTPRPSGCAVSYGIPECGHAQLAGISNGATLLHQIDIVPTLSLLLGIPIPFANLGAVIPDLLYSADSSSEWESMVGAHALNAAQIRRYMQAYQSAARSFDVRELAALEQLYEAAELALQVARESSSPEAYGLAVAKFREYLSSAARICRALWTQFDTRSMMWAIALIAASLVIQVVLAFGADASSLVAPAVHGAVLGGIISVLIDPSKWEANCVAAFGKAAGGLCTVPVHIVGGFAEALASVQLPVISDWLGLPPPVACMVLGAQALMLIKLVRSGAFPHKAATAASLASVVFLLVWAFRIATLFSNSFIEADHHVVQYCLMSLLVVCAWQASTWRNSVVLLLAAAVARVAVAVPASGFGADLVTLTGTVLPLPALVCVAAVWCQQYGYSSSWSRLYLLVNGLNCTLCLLFWGLEASTLVGGSTSVCQVVFGLSAATFLWGVLGRPVSVTDEANERTAAARALAKKSGLTTAAIAEEVFVHERGMLANWFPVLSDYQRRASVRVVFASLPCVFPLALLLGPASPLLVLLAWAQALCIAVGLAPSREAPHSAPSKLMLGTIWCLSFCHYWFASGHHTQFNKLQYGAASVIADEFSLLWSPILVWLNTYAFHIMWMQLGVLAIILSVNGGASVAQVRTAASQFVSRVQLMPTVVMLCTALFVFGARRHLMVWAIFAPKFVFDGFALVSVDLICVAVLNMAWWLSCSSSQQSRH